MIPLLQKASEEGFLHTFVAEPALIFLGAVLAVGAVVATVAWRRRRRVLGMAIRPAVADYLCGVEDAFALDHAGARVRLERALRVDPENAPARVLLAQALLGQGEIARAHEEQRVVRESFGFKSARGDAVGAATLLATDQADAAARVFAARERGADPELLRLQLRVELAAGRFEAAGATAARLAPLVAPTEAAAVAALRAQAAQRVAAARRQASPGQAAAAGGDLDSAAASTAAHPFACGRCQLHVAHPAAACPHCGTPGTLRAREPGLSEPLPAASLVADEIEETPAHVERLLTVALRGDAEASAEIIALGATAVPALWRRALAEPAVSDEVTALLVAMGPGILRALLDAMTATRAASRAADRAPGLPLLAAVAERFGRAALPVFTDLVASEDPDLRKLVIDFHIALADLDELGAVFDHYPPVEILHRLNAAPPARLSTFLAAVPARGFVGDVLLVHPMFHRDEDLLLAAARSAAPGVLLDILARRGAHVTLAQPAIAMLAQTELAPTAERFLAAAGVGVTDALLAAYLDLDRAADARARLRDLLARLGADLVPSLCQCFGGAPARIDQEVVDLLVALGPPAVAPLRGAYERRNLFERVGGRLVRRYNHPRNLIIKVLARVGGGEARRALADLRAGEADPNLKLRLEQALHALREGDADRGFDPGVSGEGRVG